MPPTLYTREDAQGATKGSTIIATGVTFLILGAVATALRLYTRISLVRKVGVEDYFIFFAWVGSKHTLHFPNKISKLTKTSYLHLDSSSLLAKVGDPFPH